MASRVNVAILGFGFMGSTHARAYLRAAREGHPCRLVAISDPAASDLRPPERFPIPPDLLPDLRSVALVRSPDSVLDDPDIQLVSICTPTRTHVDLASRALRAGKHVLVEKPVALEPGAIEALAGAARAAGRLCMPAMCMRFWPAWSFIAQTIGDLRYGGLRSASFQRLAAPPDWAPHYADLAVSGGPLFDLHVHDVDFILHAIGAPTRVETAGAELEFRTRYTIPGREATVTAESSWTRRAEQGFVMRCALEFEGAAIDFDFGRSPQLAVSVPGPRGSHPELPDLDGYDVEVRAILEAIARGAEESPVTLAEAAHVTRILLAERESLARARPVDL